MILYYICLMSSIYQLRAGQREAGVCETIDDTDLDSESTSSIGNGVDREELGEVWYFV